MRSDGMKYLVPGGEIPPPPPDISCGILHNMNIIYAGNSAPNRDELHAFFETVFNEIPDGTEFSEDQDQTLDEWFSVDEMITYLPNGQLIEARDDKTLVGALFIAKQNPITWPDGQKMEVFILGVDRNYRGQGIAKELLKRAEAFAAQYGAKKIIINTHILQEQVQAIYHSIGYDRIGVLTNYYDNGDAVFFSKNIR